MSQVICKLPKNAREQIVFSLNEWKGKHFLDLRVFLVGEDGGPDIPTKKGLTLAVDLYPQFKKGLAQVEAALIEGGWLDWEDLEQE